MASAAILAGGRARRFWGCDKGALVVAHRPILERQVQELSRITDDILIVGRPGLATDPPGLRAIDDRISDCGPLGGLDAALAAARDDALLLIAGDMPFVTAPFLQRLLDLAALADAVVPRTERGYHPLCAVYARACAPAVARRLRAGQLTMVELLEDLHVRVVGEDEIERFGAPRKVLANVNAPEDLRSIEALVSHEV